MLIRLTISSLKQLFRNKQALFWSLVFPLLFAFIFGSFFGRDTISAGTIGIINHSETDLAKMIEKTFIENEAFKIKSPKDMDEAKKMLKANQIVTAIEIPQNFGAMTNGLNNLPAPDPNASVDLIVISDPSYTQSSSIVVGIIDKILANATLQAQGGKPLYNIKQESSTSNKVSYFDFILAGLIGLSLMNSAIQGIAVRIAKYRDEKILKRITTTPLPGWMFIVSEVVSSVVLNMIQVSLLLLVGIYGFHAHIYGNIFVIYLLALLGAILFLSIGFVVSALSKTTEAAEGMATVITIPMMFLGGVFFPLDALPKWFFSVVQYIPLAPLLRMIRNVTIDGMSPISDPKNLIIVLVWIAIALTISIAKFKFSEE